MKNKIFSVYTIFLSASVLLFIGVRLRHINIAFERDEGEYTYAGQEILRGLLPYKDFYNMKMPGVYYIMAFLFRCFGDSVYTVKLSLVCINFTSAFFIFLIAKKLFGKETGITASAIYLLFCLSFSAQGWTANAEHFLILFACIGLYFTVLARDKKSNALLFFSGIFMMLAVICKQHGILFLFFTGFWFLYIAFKPILHTKRTDIKLNTILTVSKFFFVQMLFYGLGCALPFCGMLFYFWHVGILSDFYYLTFQYAQAYTDLRSDFTEIWRFRPVFWNNFGFWFLVFALIYFNIRKKISIGQDFFLPILLFMSFIAVSIGWYYRPHYFQLLFPVAAIMSAFVIVRINLFWKFAWLTPARYLVFAFVATCVMQYEYFFTVPSEQIIREMYGDHYFNQKKIIGTQMNNIIANPKGKIGIVGCEPQILYYSHRQSGTGFLYIYPLIEQQPYSTAMFEQFSKEIASNQPEILIYFEDINRASFNDDGLLRLNNWFTEYSKQYNIVAQSYIENGVSKMDWHFENNIYVPKDSTIALIYKRKK